MLSKEFIEQYISIVHGILFICSNKALELNATLACEQTLDSMRDHEDRYSFKALLRSKNRDRDRKSKHHKADLNSCLALRESKIVILIFQSKNIFSNMVKETIVISPPTIDLSL